MSIAGLGRSNNTTAVARRNGGGIRGGRAYRERFTYGDLKAEVPFSNEVVVTARAPAQHAGYLEIDDRMATTSGTPPEVVVGWMMKALDRDGDKLETRGEVDALSYPPRAGEGGRDRSDP
ncbi:hypothetical protein WME91_07315 [Sorangium sp. So ce269]